MTLYLNYWTLSSFCLLITTAPYWPVMPGWLNLIYCIALFAFSALYSRLRVFTGITFACCLILVHGNLLKHQTETLFHAGLDSTITGKVDSNFKATKFGYQGFVLVRSINGESLSWFSRPKVRLNAPIHLEKGDEFQAYVKIKPVIGLLNSVGFDAEKQAIIEGVVGSVSVVANTSMYSTQQRTIRQIVINRADRSIEQLNNVGIVRALLFAERDSLSNETWLELKQSGLTHLIAISGLHIGIIFTVGWGCGLLIYRILRAGRLAPLFTGLIFASCYAWLAGFTLPTQRALIMCFLFCAIQSRWGNMSAASKWLLTLALLLTLDPFSTLSMSLWLSMFAVGVILLILSLRSFRYNWALSTLAVQTAITLAMAPLLASYFNGLSLGSLFYNLLFIPWFSFVVIPFAFLSLLLTSLGLTTPWLWQLVDWLLEPVLYAIGHSSWGWISLSHTETHFLWILLASSFIAVWFHRWAALLMTMTLTLSQVKWQESPIWSLTMLDVGHGLAVVIEQRGRTLVYDVGRAGSGSSIVASYLSPFLQYRGVRSVDALVISHFDNDHAGGWHEFTSYWRPTQLVSSQLGVGSRACTQGERWQWGSIKIDVLWPPELSKRAYNPHSCVLKLTHSESHQSVLLTGDIERIAEWALLRERDKLKADLVTVPHHGSNSSSLSDFVASVAPRFALASTAKQGRWNLPKKDIVERYKNVGALWLDTGSEGQITFNFYPDRVEHQTLRNSKAQPWYRQMLRKGVE